jgi:precorrin-6A/cobalt-precorrin-6A reductase
VLVLGGSSEASALVAALAGRADVDLTLSLAGRTVAPAAQPVPTRIGGFGGAAGLAAYAAAERVELLVDATHPFAARISASAREAAARAGCRLLDVTRPPWVPQPGDRWTAVASMEAAVDALGSSPLRVFLTVGRLQLANFAVAPQHHYLVRTIDPLADVAALPNATCITGRGPFEPEAEAALMRRHRIDVLVTKNSGGTATAAKLDAARRLALPVILVRPPRQGGATLAVAEAVAAILSHRVGTERGV